MDKLMNAASNKVMEATAALASAFKTILTSLLPSISTHMLGFPIFELSLHLAVFAAMPEYTGKSTRALES
jgi:hypothetical protein